MQNIIKAYIEQKTGLDVVTEFHFAKPRKYRFDFAIVKYRIAIEIEGGTRKKQTEVRKCKCGKIHTFSAYYGRHNSPEGYKKDCEKYNLAAVLNWKVLRYTYEHIEKDISEIADDIKKIVMKRGQQ